MVDTGHGRRPGQHYTVASEQAAAYRANSRSTAPRNVSNPYQRAAPPTDDDERSMNARHPYRDNPPTGRGGRRSAEELGSSDDGTASDMDAWSSEEDWCDDAATLADVEMADGTGASGSRNRLLSGPQRASYARPMEFTTAGRNFTPYSQYLGPPEAGSSTRFNVVHGHGAGTSTRYESPTPRYNTRESAKMCIVCRDKPVYKARSGTTPYKTCGLTCAAKLEEEQGRARTYSQRSSSPRNSRSAKCVVCKVREPYYNRSTGKRFPTCGNNCAAILKGRSGSTSSSSKAAGTCDQCHKQPKALNKTTGKPYDFCSTQCRDKQNSLLEKAIAGTCQTCLICLEGEVHDVDRPYCGPECLAAGMSVAPALVEIPKGHIMFEKYHRRFQQDCDASSDNQPTVRHMYFFAQSGGVLERFTEYKEQLKAPLRRGRALVEKELWISIPRKCNTGDSGEINTCSSPNCYFCIVVCNGFRRATFPEGVTLASTPTLAAASNRAGGAGSARRTKAVLMVQLVHAPGKVEEVRTQDIRDYGSEMRKQHAVVKIVTRTAYSRTKETGEVHVFKRAAILPLGCIVYA